ncbi:RHS repeat-associated core domain-containing protein [Hymenobacter elongatus]|uniref:RHS repeat-associated core domain-containing protein n=1 Tax=Hymenobacter elongatus TaxID=877208 RepID=A0A4Z0PGD0_9BACT|nr:RHS repeat-associated core domain-containing protein [Hymenobacter elongatus]TGE13824.1 hypothetical protein E5J99_18900 [Hymenobacter elongatus]
MHPYPFGLALAGVAVNTLPAEQTSKELYNGGSELQDELLGEGGVYSTFFRTYDPTTGRFQGIDPLADKYADHSPYSFAFNDPINFNDPTGAEPSHLEDSAFMYGRYVNMRVFDGGGGGEWTGSALGHMMYQQGSTGVNTGYGGMIMGHYENRLKICEAKVRKGVDALGKDISVGSGEFHVVVVKVWVYGEPHTNGNGWLSPASTLNGGIGVATSIVGEMDGNITLSPNVYSGSAQSYRYYRLQSRIVNIPKTSLKSVGKIGGFVTLIIGSLLDAKGVLNYYRNGATDINAVHPAKASFNLVYGLSGIAAGIPGAIGGAGYFFIDTFYPGGMHGALENNARIQQHNRDILGNSFNIYRE